MLLQVFARIQRHILVMIVLCLLFAQNVLASWQMVMRALHCVRWIRPSLFIGYQIRVNKNCPCIRVSTVAWMKEWESGWHKCEIEWKTRKRSHEKLNFKYIPFRENFHKIGTKKNRNYSKFCSLTSITTKLVESYSKARVLVVWIRHQT